MVRPSSGMRSMLFSRGELLGASRVHAVAVMARAHGYAERDEGGDRENEHDPFAVVPHGLGVGLVLSSALHVVTATAMGVEPNAHGGALLFAHVLPGHCHVHPPPGSSAYDAEEQHAEQQNADQG